MTLTSLRALIADDEAIARSGIRRLLAREPDIEIVGECRNGREAVAAILDAAPDLIFLDIQMPELDGFEVLNRLPPERVPVVIFVTAYDEHALRAFDAHALDYLLKPIDEARFRAALARARELAAGRSARRLVAPALERIVVRASGRIFFLPVASIDWIEAADNYVCLHSNGKSHIVSEKIGVLEQRLDARRFVRVHRSRIVNLDRVREVHPLFNGDYVFRMQDGAEVGSGRNYRERVRGLLRNPAG